MKKLDFKVIFVALILFIIAIISLVYWELVSKFIMNILKSKSVTIGGWILLTITAFIHYHKNKYDDKNFISEKEGLDKPIDYLQFVLTFGAIGTSVQVLSREVFAFYNFPELCNTNRFLGFDIVSFLIVIVVLTFHSYGKIKPVLQETYIEKNKIETKSNIK